MGSKTARISHEVRISSDTTLPLSEVKSAVYSLVFRAPDDKGEMQDYVYFGSCGSLKALKARVKNHTSVAYASHKSRKDWPLYRALLKAEHVTILVAFTDQAKKAERFATTKCLEPGVVVLNQRVGGTPTEQERAKYSQSRKGTPPPGIGERVPVCAVCRKTGAQYFFDSVNQAAKGLTEKSGRSVYASNVSKAMKNKLKSSGGFFFRHAC